LANVALILPYHDSNITLPNVEKLIVHGSTNADSGFGESAVSVFSEQSTKFD
jgi:hypothetical protein